MNIFHIQLNRTIYHSSIKKTGLLKNIDNVLKLGDDIRRVSNSEESIILVKKVYLKLLS